MNNLTESLTNSSNLFENRHQSSIYLSLLENGNSGVTAISKDTGIHAETIQRELKKMEKLSTVHISKKGRNKVVSPVEISQLQELVESQVTNFNLLLRPLLEVAQENQNPKLEVYSGSHSFGLLEIKLLKLQPESEPISVISTHPKQWLSAMVSSGKLSQFEKLRLKKEVPFKLSCFLEKQGEVEKNNRDYFAGQSKELKRQYRYVDTDASSPIQIQIWHSHVVMSIFDAKPSIHMVFEDKSIVTAMSAYFKVLWNKNN